MYILREGNKGTDRLANMSVDQDHQMVSLIILPDELIPLREMDMKGVAFERF